MNKKNQFLILFLTIMVLQISIFNEKGVSAETELAVYYDDFTMVPISEISKALRANVDWNAATQTVTVKKGTQSMEITIGSPYATINREQVWLDLPAMLLKGKTFVTMSLMEKAFDSEMSWDAHNKTVIVKVRAKSSEAEQQTLTLDQALSWAITNSQLIKKAEQDIKKQEVERQTAGNGTDDDSSAKISLEMAKKMKEVAVDQATALLKKAYQDVFLKEEDVKLKAMSYGIANKGEEIALAKYQIGLISLEEKTRLTEAKALAWSNLQLVKSDLQKSRVKLNSLMGKPEDTLFLLVDRMKSAKSIIMQEEIESYIQTMAVKNPYLWQAEKQVETEKEKDSSDSYELKKMAVENAEAALTAKQKEFAESIKSIQLSLIQLEEQYQKADSQFQLAVKELRTQITKYEKGWITLLDVMRKQLEVEQSRKALLEFGAQIEQARLRWEKPWL